MSMSQAGCEEEKEKKSFFFFFEMSHSAIERANEEITSLFLQPQNKRDDAQQPLFLQRVRRTQKSSHRCNQYLSLFLWEEKHDITETEESTTCLVESTNRVVSADNMDEKKKAKKEPALFCWIVLACVLGMCMRVMEMERLCVCICVINPKEKRIFQKDRANRGCCSRDGVVGVVHGG